MRKFFALPTCVVLLALCSLALGQDTKTAPKPKDKDKDRLVTLSGETIEGHLERISEGGVLRLMPTGSGKPYNALLSHIRRIYFNVNNPLPSDYLRRTYVYYLTDGSRISGRVVKSSPKKIVIKNEYAGEITIPINILRYVSMSINVTPPSIINDTGAHIIVLNDNRKINCRVLIPTAAGDKSRTNEIKYVVGGEKKSVPATEVKGILYAPGVKGKKKKGGPGGWYATVSMPNYDRMHGIVYSMSGGVLKLVTSRLGVVEIKRKFIKRVSFGKKLASDFGYLYVCDFSSSLALKLDEEMRIVWSYKMKEGHPLYVRPLANGNILLGERDYRIVEISPEKIIVWEKKLSGSFLIRRLPNGNTLVSRCKGIAEIDADGKLVKTHLGNYSTRYFDVTTGGKFFVGDMITRSAMLLDAKGKVIFTHPMVSPGCVRALPDGRFAVLDQQKRAIEILGPQLKLLSSIPIPNPYTRSFCVRESGNIIFAKWDGKKNTICEYDTNGKLVSQKTAEGVKFAIRHIDFR